MSSFAEPFLMAATTLMLSHWNNIFVLEGSGPHTAQHKKIRSNSFAIIPVVVHSEGRFHCNQSFPNSAPQPQDPEASVCIELQGTELSGLHRMRLNHSTSGEKCATTTDLSGMRSLVWCRNPVVELLLLQGTFLPQKFCHDGPP